jgi:dTDP-4-amino-4,6-dideoxygalactose transaminase
VLATESSVTTRNLATVPFLRPQLPALTDVATYYDMAERARFYSNGGPCEQLLRRRLSEYLDGVHCVPVSNATMGIIAALRAVTELRGTADRSLVVTPSYTFAATAGAPAHLGFRPLFVDVDADAWQMDAAALEQVLAERAHDVAAVLATTTFGTPPSPATSARWEEACRRYGVPLVVDSAAAFGAVDADGARTGTGDAVHVFSFHATKPFGIGEGGMITTRDEAVYDYCDAFRQFGFSGGKVATLAGINMKLDELHSAVALTVLDRYDGILRARRRTAARYRQAFEPFGFRFQGGSGQSTWQGGYAMAPDPATRTALLAAAPSAKVELKTYYDVPVHRHPAFAADPTHGRLPISEQLAACAVSFPMANDLTDDEIARVVALVLDVVGRN